MLLINPTCKQVQLAPHPKPTSLPNYFVIIFRNLRRALISVKDAFRKRLMWGKQTWQLCRWINRWVSKLFPILFSIKSQAKDLEQSSVCFKLQQICWLFAFYSCYTKFVTVGKANLWKILITGAILSFLVPIGMASFTRVSTCLAFNLLAFAFFLHIEKLPHWLYLHVYK